MSIILKEKNLRRIEVEEHGSIVVGFIRLAIEKEVMS